MKASAGKPTEASRSWLAFLFPCWTPRLRAHDQYEKEKFPSLVYDQPFPQGNTVVVTGQATSSPPARRLQSRSNTSGSSRLGLSIRKAFRSDISSRWPSISAPSEFRHVDSGALPFAPARFEQPSFRAPVLRTRSEPRRTSFRPLELSIYVDDDGNLSPILPHFESIHDVPTAPPPAYMPRRSHDDHELVHQRSDTSLPFHLPRRQFAEEPLSDEMALRLSGMASSRHRAYTSPDVDTLKARVASAMIEMERLQKQIDDVIERQSVYAMSRPTTPRTVAAASSAVEIPLPSIPALPPAAPSFAQRLNSDVDRPSTTYAEPVLPSSGQAKNRNNGSHTPSPAGSPIMPPPLPLVLRPPLRKKKSFSRVSRWLAEGGKHHHNRNISVDSVTNSPRPIKDKEGFYQSVAPGESHSSSRHSQESAASALSWDTDEQRTTTTAWSPNSTPLSKEVVMSFEKRGTFGKALARTSVGVAV